MKKRYFILMVLLVTLVSVAMLRCGSGTDNLPADNKLAGGWIINPSTGNDKNFIVVSGTGTILDHGFRGFTAAIHNSGEDTFQVGLTSGASSLVVNATMATADTAAYILYPGASIGIMSRVADLTACYKMSRSWWTYMNPDGGASAPKFKPTRHALNGISFSLSFDIGAEGNITSTGPGYFTVTDGRMICNGTAMDDLVVGLMATNAASSPYPEYKTIKIAGIVNGPDLIGGLYNSESSAWPLGSFEMMYPAP